MNFLFPQRRSRYQRWHRHWLSLGMTIAVLMVAIGLNYRRTNAEASKSSGQLPCQEGQVFRASDQKCYAVQGE